MGSGATPTFYLSLHLEIDLKVWIPIQMWDRNLSEQLFFYSFLLKRIGFAMLHSFILLSSLYPRNSPRKHNPGKEKQNINIRTVP